MSRTKKDRNNQRRMIENALLFKTLKCYSEDIVGKRKNRKLSRTLRKRLKRINQKEIKGEIDAWIIKI